MYMCVCMFVCVSTGACVSWHTCGCQRKTLGGHQCLLTLLKQGHLIFSPAWPRLAGLELPGILLSLCPFFHQSIGITDINQPIQLYISPGNPNSGPHICMHNKHFYPLEHFSNPMLMTCSVPDQHCGLCHLLLSLVFKLDKLFSVYFAIFPM